MCAYTLCLSLRCESTLSIQITYFFFFSSRRRHTIFDCDWSSDVCSSDLGSSSTTARTGEHGPTSAGSARGGSSDAARRSEERRVGKECRSRWSPYHSKKKYANECPQSLFDSHFAYRQSLYDCPVVL